MKPSEWVKGMTIISKAGKTYVLTERRPCCPGWLFEGSAIGLSDDATEVFGRRPATYADLSREPVVGERAVLVNANHAAGDHAVGSVWICIDATSWHPEGELLRNVYWESNRFAPHEPALSGQTMSGPDSTWKRLCACGQEIARAGVTGARCSDCFTVDQIIGWRDPGEPDTRPRLLAHPLSAPVLGGMNRELTP